jgi:hypothetical protein
MFIQNMSEPDGFFAFRAIFFRIIIDHHFFFSTMAKAELQ